MSTPTNNSSQPTVSLNKLAEFIHAKGARRKAIVKEAKYPDEFRGARYRDARQAICRYLVSGCDERVLVKAIDRLRNKEANKKWHITEQKNGILAIEKAIEMNFPEISRYEVRAFDGRANLDIANVQVRVNPELLLTNKKNGKLGAVKLHIIKGSKLDEHALEYISTVVRCFLDKAELGPVDPKSCHSIDIFTGLHTFAPPAFARTMADIEANCEEFKLRWDQL